MNSQSGGGGQNPYSRQIPQGHMMMPSGHMMQQGQGQFINYGQGQFVAQGQGQRMMINQPMFNANMMGMRPAGAPPSYHQALNQSSIPRQRMGGPQMQRPAKSEDQIQKEKYYQQQQAKLKQFKKTGGTSLDPNKLVDSIFGATSAAKPKQSPSASAHSAVAGTDDAFGDFLGSQPDSLAGSPVSQSFTSPLVGTNLHSAVYSAGTSQQTAALNSGTSQQNTLPETGTGHQPATLNVGTSPPTSPPARGTEKKDLTKMMLESCDLNAPQKAKLFQKPALKEINPVHVQAPAHHTSQNARRWDRSEELSQLFIQEAVKDESTLPKAKPKAVTTRRRRPSAQPTWLTDDSLLPPVYKHVLEACFLGGHISVERLYPILMLSGLPREVMGRLWSLCNTAKPGELTVKELYQLLAVIALVQNNYKVESVDILSQCPQAPVPFLATAGAPPPQQQPVPGPILLGTPGVPMTGQYSAPTGIQPGPQSPLGIQSAAQIPVGSHLVGNQSTVNTPAVSQFVGNQSSSQASMAMGVGPYPSPQVPVLPGIGGFTSHVTAAVTSSMTSLPATLPVTQLPPAGVPLRQQGTTVGVPLQLAAADDDDDFADFQAASVSPPKTELAKKGPVSKQPTMEPVKDASKFVYTPPVKEVKQTKTLSSPDIKASTVQNFFGSDDSSENTSPDDEYLDGYKSADSKPSDSTSQFSTDQSEGEDFKNFENYLDEFQRKKNMQDKESPLHRPIAKFLGKENIPASPKRMYGKQPEPVKQLFSPPPAKQSKTSNVPSSDEFSDFADFQSAPVLADVSQSTNNVAQSTSNVTQSTNNVAQSVNKTDPLKASGSAIDLIGEEDKYAALRSLEFPVEKEEEILTIVMEESNEVSKLPEDTDDNWADFQTVSNDTDDLSGLNVAATKGIDVLQRETGKDVTSKPLPAGLMDFSVGIGVNSSVNTISKPPLQVESSVVPVKEEEESWDWAEFKEGEDDFTDFQSSVEDAGQTSDPKKTELVNVKKDKLDANEILGLFKVKSEPIVNVKGRDDDATFPSKAEISVSSAMNKMHGIVPDRPKSPEAHKQKHLSEEDDFMKPPPIGDFHDIDHDDVGTFHRGYEFDDFMGSKPPEKKNIYGVYGINETFVVEGHKKDSNDPAKITIELTKDSDNDTDSISSKDDTFRGKLGLNKAEDSQSVASLDLVVNKSLQNVRDNGEGDSQSVSSNDLSNYEAGVNKDILAESKSLDSLDLRREETAGTESSQEGGTESGQDISDRESKEESPPLEQQGYVKPEFDIGIPYSTQPIISDRYSAISHDVPGSDKHEYEWLRCLDNCCKMIQDANNTFNSVSSSSVCNEVIRSSQGSQYVQGIIEIYRVVCKITVTMNRAGLYNEHLTQLLKDIDLAWNNLTAFLVGGSVMPDEKSLDFSHGALLCDDSTSQYKACGVCLLDVEMKMKGLNLDNANAKLTYGGRQYHAPCANFWINCVDSTLPALRLPELI